MAVTVEKRPIGVTLGSALSATINQDYGSAYATVNKTSHGLSDGQYVYIKSNVENYNGFWIIDVINANEFILRDAPYVAWIADCDCTYYPQATVHGWSCVHLPIVYGLSNTRFPINRVDTARTISSISNDGGYVKLNLSGSLGTFEELAFLKISSAPTSSNNGIYQIVDKTSTSVVTINLSYAAVTNAGLAGATVQLYYQNYTILVRVYAGLNSSHEWADQKPYELAATLQLTPQSDNTVTFSINEILKSYVKTKNNLTLGTLPNNIDAWTNFYIEIAEQYDTSNGYTITTTTSGYSTDQGIFEGYALNAMLAFKNVHSGYLSEYIMTSTTSKFLTLFAIPVFFACSDDLPDCYNEVSFIINEQQAPNPIVAGVANGYTNNSDTGNSWNLGTSTVTFNTAGLASTKTLMTRFKGSSGVSYNFNYNVRLTGTWTATGAVRIGLVGLDINGNKVTSTSVLATGISGSTVNASGTTSFVPSVDIEYIGFVVDIAGTLSTGLINGLVNSFSLSGTATYKLRKQFYSNSVLLSTVDEAVPDYDEGVYRMPLTVSSSYDRVDLSIIRFLDGVEDQAVSETKQCEINSGCSEQEIRLTWLNNLGGFDYWRFTAQKEYTVDITNSGETKENIFPQWSKSYGEFADTIRKQTFRESANRRFIYSQFLTQDQADALAYIKSSPLVQIINSRTDRRTVIVDTDSFTKYKDGDKTYTVQFNILFTDDIPSQSA